MKTSKKPETAKLNAETSMVREVPEYTPLSGFKSQFCFADAPVACPATPSAFHGGHEALSRGCSSFSSAFSLIELLVVIAILGLLAAVALPGIGSVTQAGNVSRGGQILGDEIILARQEATARNRDIEVRLVDLSDPLTSGFRGIQLWLVDETGTNKSAIGRLNKLPDGVVIAANSLSPLLDADSSVSGTTNFAAAGNRLYKGFRIRANGNPSSAITSTNNFLTVQLARDTGVPPPNYYSVRVDPSTGRVTIHRP